MTKVKTIAHRGYPYKYPENTLEGFSAAITLGADILELDINIDEHGKFWICHDEPEKYADDEKLSYHDFLNWVRENRDGIPSILLDLKMKTEEQMNLFFGDEFMQYQEAVDGKFETIVQSSIPRFVPYGGNYKISYLPMIGYDYDKQKKNNTSIFVWNLLKIHTNPIPMAMTKHVDVLMIERRQINPFNLLYLKMRQKWYKTPIKVYVYTVNQKWLDRLLRFSCLVDGIVTDGGPKGIRL